MVSPELIRRYPFFAGLSMEQIVILAKAASAMTVEAEHYFFREGEELDHFYVVVEGAVAIMIDLPDESAGESVSQQLMGDFKTSEVVLSSIGPGEMFAWSALIPPHNATSSGKCLTPGRVISFDCGKLRKTFEEDYQFGYLMVQKFADIIRERLRAMRIETLAHIVT